MSNLLELVYDLKDFLSPKLAAANRAGDRSLSNLASSAQKMSSTVAYASSSAGNSIAGIGTAADKSLSKIERLSTAMGHLGRGGGIGMGGMIGGAALAGALSFGGLGILKAGANAQQDLIGLSTFVGEKRAAGIYEQLQKDAAATPFDTKSLLAVDRALISAGVSADKARVDMLGLANAISATGGGNAELARMATNMQQIKTTGEATAADIKQFSYAGINIYQLLADATGKPLAKTKDMTVSYDLLSYALNKAATSGGLYHDAMKKQSESLQGKWSTLIDDIGISAAKIGLSIAPEINKVIDQWIGYANGLPALAEKWKPAIISIVRGLGDFASMLIGGAKLLYNNWYWIKYVAGATLVFVGVIKLINTGLTLYNTITALSAARTALFGTAQTAAAAAMSRTAISTGWATTATTAYGYAVQSATGSLATLGTASTSIFAGISAGAVAATGGIAALALGLGYLLTKDGKGGLGNVASLDGRDYVNPLAGGIVKTYQDTSTYNLVNGVKQYTGGIKKMFIPASDTGSSFNPLLKYGINPAGFAKNFPDLAKNAKSGSDDPFSKYKDLYKGVTDMSDSVVGGGKKSITINFYKDAIKQEFSVASLASAVNMSVEEFTKMLMRSLESVKGAM